MHVALLGRSAPVLSLWGVGRRRLGRGSAPSQTASVCSDKEKTSLVLSRGPCFREFVPRSYCEARDPPLRPLRPQRLHLGEAGNSPDGRPVRRPSRVPPTE